MILPYIKRLTAFCHSKGLWYEQHSCGRNELLAPCMVEANIDMWLPQSMNDIDMLIEKYGDKIILGVYPSIGMEATPEENDAAAKELAQKYAPLMGSKPIVLVNFGSSPEFASLVYRYSREVIAAG
jgi:hypothetical protein